MIFFWIILIKLACAAQTPINYWSFNGNLNDVVSGANAIGGANYNFTNDRFNNPNSALNLKTGFVQLPKGVYFNGDFTFTAWVNIRKYAHWCRIFDFGIGSRNNNVLLALASDSGVGKLQGQIFLGNSLYPLARVPNAFQLNSWQHVAFVSESSTIYLYINGTLVATASCVVAQNVVRTTNYFGRSNWYPADSDTDGILDEIKIYNVALNPQEIMNEYNYIQPTSTTTTSTSSSTSISTKPPPTTSKYTSTSTTTSTTSTSISSFTSTSSTISSTIISSSISFFDDDSLFIGCFKDKNQRDIDGLYFDNVLINSPSKCIELCRTYNFKYAGVQNEYQCFCGDHYNLYGPSDNCNHICPGDQSEICGGSWSNSIYEIFNIGRFIN